MKNLLVFILVCFHLVALAQERTPKTPEERANAITTWMHDKLVLTAEQEPTVRSINLKYANLNENIAKGGGRQMQKLRQLKASDQAKDKELKSVLTEAQFKTYEAKKEELKEKIKEYQEEKKKGN